MVKAHDALFLPSSSAHNHKDDLPYSGSDIVAGKFQESMEAEAKPLKAT